MYLLKKFPSVIHIKAIAAFFAVVFVTSLCFWQGNVAEAGADIHWKTTSVSIEPGKAVVSGYFQNDGNARGAITKFEIWGHIAQYKVNVTFSDSTLTVGSLGAGNMIKWRFTIRHSDISYSDSNPRYNFDSRVTFR